MIYFRIFLYSVQKNWIISAVHNLITEFIYIVIIMLQQIKRFVNNSGRENKPLGVCTIVLMLMLLCYMVFCYFRKSFFSPSLKARHTLQLLSQL